MIYVIAYVSVLVLFVAADAVWLTTMADRIYRPALGDMMLTNFRLMPAVGFYLLYPVGLVIFAINPALKTGAISTAALFGALFGFFTYMTYDLTNQATLRHWSTVLTLADIAWGCALGAVASAGAFLIVGRFAR